VGEEQPAVTLATVAREWGRIGCVGFGGPPAHINLLRRLCVDEHQWLSPAQFEDGIAATNLLPGPASTQLAILCAWQLRGAVGAVVGGLCFVVPGLVAILLLAAAFLAEGSPVWVRGAAAGGGAAVAAVAVHAGLALAPASWRRAGPARAARIRWACYLLVGGVAAAMAGPFVVVVLVAAGLVETTVTTLPRRGDRTGGSRAAWAAALVAQALPVGGLGALAWTSFKVGALSYGGGFVIIPLMRADAVEEYHWMSSGEFLSAVALGQITPGPVVQTVAVVGYAAAGIGGGLLAAAVAFGPSFLFVVMAAPWFDRLRANRIVQAFLSGAGPAAIGAIMGSAVPLALSISYGWQVVVLVAAAGWLLVARRGVISALLASGVAGAVAALAGMPVPG
jgi:chromate transporter